MLYRCLLLSDGNDVVDVSQETTLVPTGHYAAIALDVETGNKKFGICWILEARDSKALAGQAVSLSFRARTTGAISIDHLRAGVVSWTSTADAPTSQLVAGGAWGAAATNPTLATNWAFDNAPVSLATLTTSYQTFKIENISVASGANNVAVFIWIDDVTTTVTEILYIGGVQLEIGSIATDFEHRAFAEELELCQRYYAKTFPYVTAPAQNAGVAGAMACVASGTVGGRAIQLIWQRSVLMRTDPTITTYDPSATNANIRNVDAPGDETVAVEAGESDDRSTVIGASSTVADLERHRIHATADAEL